MFTKLSAPQRIQIGLVLAMAFLLVLGSNLLDQKHFTNIQNTVNSVYKDRVVVQDYVYRLGNIFHQKELRFILKNNFQGVTSENQEVKQLLDDFGATELTTKESQLLIKLNDQFANLNKLEIKMMGASSANSENNMVSAVKSLDEIGTSLNGLAEIQLDQSGQLIELSKKSLGMNILLSKLEIGFMVVIGAAMLALIFYPVEKIRVIR
ncbi:MAG TPA: hypothetical protein ENH87_19780 [Pricia antarctica]|uniref:Four helix bundle sensory module for signal transduction n=2 Tax=root TaxID=1 RepID=A0A831QV58_9FLAO|nr:hypothetical protein [Pricia antarctica]